MLESRKDTSLIVDDAVQSNIALGHMAFSVTTPFVRNSGCCVLRIENKVNLAVGLTTSNLDRITCSI